MPTLRALLLTILLVTTTSANAKDTPFQTVSWPASGETAIRFTFSKFKLLTNGVGREHGYITDATAENVSGRVIGRLNLLMYVYDKNNARIGDSNIDLTNVGAGQAVKFEVTVYATGTPSSISLASTAPRLLSLTVNSVPQGAMLRVDGKEVGTTPKIVEIALGKHMLDSARTASPQGIFRLRWGRMTPREEVSVMRWERRPRTRSNCGMARF